jgi:hypothetical protein
MATDIAGNRKYGAANDLGEAVEMRNNAEGDRAIAAVNGHEVGGRALNVNEGRPKGEGGGGFGRKPSRWEASSQSKTTGFTRSRFLLAETSAEEH